MIIKNSQSQGLMEETKYDIYFKIMTNILKIITNIEEKWNVAKQTASQILLEGPQGRENYF